MRYTLPDAERAAVIPCKSVDPLKNLSGTPLTLYRALQATALRAAEARGYVRSTTHVTLHCPLEIVGLSLDRSRTTIWRAAKRLKALGLIDQRPHKTTALDGRTVNDGSLWAVRLDPEGEAPARLTAEDLQHRWRDLDRDRRRGRTAHKAVQAYRAEKVKQSKTLPTTEVDLELLAAWAIAPQPTENPLSNDCFTAERRDLESVLDVQYAAVEDRNEAVDGAAKALAAGLRDASGLNFYRALLWALLRYADRGLDAPWYAIYEQARRARADAAEGFARRPGALYVSRLKAAPWWDELKRTPPVRVGTRPRRPGA